MPVNVTVPSGDAVTSMFLASTRALRISAAVIADLVSAADGFGVILMLFTTAVTPLR